MIGARSGFLYQEVAVVCRRYKNFGCLILAVTVGAVAALLFPVWLIASLLAILVILLGILLICG